MKRDLLQQAYGAMRHDLRKTMLTMLGMAWGIATVVLLLAYGDGFGQAIHHIFESFGATAVGVFPGRTSLQAGGNKAGVQVRFTDADVEVLRNVLPLSRHICRQSDMTAMAVNSPRSFSMQVFGDDPCLQSIWNLKTAEGRFVNDQDNSSHGLYVVLGSEAKEKLFSGMTALGQTVGINGVSFEVVGVLQPRMQEQGDNDNRVLYIPYNSMDVLQDIHYIGGIWLDSQGLDNTHLTETIRNALAITHNFKPGDDRAVRVFDVQRQLEQFGIILLGLKILLGFIGTVTLGIGGVGLMNIMLVSVTQRTREIGVEKALGARRRHIFLQFLAEALTITFIGGLLGIILAYVVAFSVGRLTLYSAMAKHAEAGDIRLMINPVTLVVAVLILTAVGLISGMVPAIRASRLDPIEALRYE
jgi:putative ABC transport system permease protein